MNRRVIPIAAPKAPKCFPSRDQWVQYLISAQKHFKPERRPFVGEQYRPTFSFCRDCPAEHRQQMEGEGRCGFESYVASVIAQQEETNAATA